MKKTYTTLLFCALACLSFAQNKYPISAPNAIVNYPYELNNAGAPCITPEQYALIEKRCNNNERLLHLSNSANKGLGSPVFIWPARAANNYQGYSYYFLGNYVDHDTSSFIRDYNCGELTYDGHRGTDITLWPYPFYMMEHNNVEAIAAADGIILDKADGNYDKNCKANTLLANYVVVRHADGSRTLYSSLKSGLNTVKLIGQTILAGEYLGVVGSSGNSTSPHLHFEVWTNNSSTSLTDPCSGVCNTLDTTTWWVAQKPYTEPAIMSLETDSIVPPLPVCPKPEILANDSCFDRGDSIVFGVCMRDAIVGESLDIDIRYPNGTIYKTWSYIMSGTYRHTYYYWTKAMPKVTGTYSFEATYNSFRVTKKFNINCFDTIVTPPLNIAYTGDLSTIQVSPNPASNKMFISSSNINNGHYRLALKSVIGATLLSEDVLVTDHTLQKELSITSLPNGIYYLYIQSNNSSIVKKVIKGE